VILLDTSAWIEFLRDTGSPVCQRVDEVLADDIATCDPVRMEVLAGARSDTHLRELRGLLARAVSLQVTPAHYELAATLFRSARQEGLTVRRLNDCLIAAVAITHEVPLLHADRDFDALVHVSDLMVDTA
jgi:predicted nucleic acid-binding protein